ncbi:glycosyltransferase family 2 protein [Methylobacterium mesophilicum]
MASYSIVIINHNYARFVSRAIKSALSQILPAAQVIVVDDGSSDNSREIIESFSGSIQSLFTQQQGHVGAVNAGYELSTSDYCIFLDADDFLYENCLQRLDVLLQPGVVKIQFRLDTVDLSGENQNLPFPHFPSSLTSDEIYRQSIAFGVYPWTVSSGNAYSKFFLDLVFPLNKTIVYRSPDGFLNKVCPLYGRVLSSREILGAYRVHGANAWAHSQKNINIESVTRWLNFDLVLQNEFEKLAMKQNISVKSGLLVRSLQQLEYKLISLRFGRKSGFEESKTLLKYMLLGLSFVFKAPNISFFGKVIWFMWLLVLSVFPTRVITKLYGRGRGQLQRSSFSRFLVNISRSPAGPK